MKKLDVVKTRDANGLCIACGEQPKGERRRGLCTRCYGRYRAELRQLPANERKTFEAQAIRYGLLMPDRQGQRVGEENNAYAILAGLMRDQADEETIDREMKDATEKE